MTAPVTCLILGGGLGTRMRPATEQVPKPLLDVAGEPFVAHQLRWLVSEGITEVVYSIGYLGYMIREALESRHDLGCSLRFVDEGDAELGTGGAIRYALDTGALQGTFYVLYGDSYLSISLREVFQCYNTSHAEALMTVYRNEGRRDPSNVVFDGHMVVRYDKTEQDPRGAGMQYIDYGLSILRCESVRARLPAGRPSDLADMLRSLSEEGRLKGYEARERFYEIGSPEGLADLQQHLSSSGP